MQFGSPIVNGKSFQILENLILSLESYKIFAWKVVTYFSIRSFLGGKIIPNLFLLCVCPSALKMCYCQIASALHLF